MRTLQMKISPQSMGTCSEETELKRRFKSMRVRKDRAVCRGRADVLPVRMAASLIRTIVSMASGEQAQPGALGKGIGLIVGGAVLCALKAIVTSIIGQDPATMKFY